MGTVWFKLYTRKEPTCEWCQKARELLRVYGKNYYEIDINDKGVKEMFSERGFKTVPQVFREDKHIGGYNAIEEFLREEQNDKEEEYRRNKKRAATEA